MEDRPKEYATFCNDTRNFVIHANDSMKPDILWGIVINHMPLLKKEIENLLNQQ